jgi:hypothetical protein
MRLTKDYLPSQVRWIQDSVQSLQPDENAVTLRDGRKLHYETLIVASGLQIDWQKIPGLNDALEDASCPVASIYHYRHSEKAQRVLSGLTHGQAIFTVPVGGVKCGGAPQKIMWIWESNWAAAGTRPNINIAFSCVPPITTHKTWHVPNAFDLQPAHFLAFPTLADNAAFIPGACRAPLYA